MNRNIALAISFTAILLVSCAAAAMHFLRSDNESPVVPTGLNAIDWPPDNDYSTDKAALGKLLFFDTRLSPEQSLSCASCHSPKHAFAENISTSIGLHGRRGFRNAPALINAAYGMQFFWDGRAVSLEDQVKGPIANPIEMGSSPETIVTRIGTVHGYAPYFERAFGSREVTWPRIAQSISTFERTLLSGNSPYDRYQAGEKSALTASQIRGLGVFRESRCPVCHSAPYFTNGSYANLGIGADRAYPDTGRFAVTNDTHDWGAFRVPTLRDVALTAPYMHDGSIQTLEAVVDIYDRGGIPNRNLDARIHPLEFAPQQKLDLVAFLQGLTGDEAPVTPPEHLPQ